MPDGSTSSVFRGQQFLVTGASSGLGRATARYLALAGARVLLNGRSLEQLHATLETLEGSGHQILPKALGDLDEACDWLVSVAKQHGPLDGIVHSAGIQHALPIRSMKHAHFESMMGVNVESAVGLIKGFRQKRVHAEGGAVVLISSVMGLVGQPLQAGYSATKGAIIALVRSAALETAKDGIRVNCIAPAVVETEMIEGLKSSMTPEQFEAVRASHPLGLGRPEDVAEAAGFLLGKKSARWITGTTLVLDGGYSAV